MTEIQLITEFINRFLDYDAAQNNYGELADKSIEELCEVYDMELGEAKRRWPSLNTDSEWAEMDRWLSERGYIEPKYRED